MKRETFRELVEKSPLMTEDMWGELAALTRRHTCLQAFFGNMLNLAGNEIMQLPNVSISDEGGRERHNVMKGLIRGYQHAVSDACDRMGDTPEEAKPAKGEALFPDENDGMPVSDRKPRSRRIAVPPPRRKAVAKKRSKK